ncbi:MAG: hypothetical protein U5K43_09665 [Halofilum sp. (in: g-proteobacteria)]|nr:hypothetical protein [Halofilum sp. (in: g-proteobacteria)]
MRARRASSPVAALRRRRAAARWPTHCPDDMADFLLRKFELNREALYQVNGPVNLNRLLAVYDLVDRSDLKYPPSQPPVPERTAAGRPTCSP